MRQTHTLTALRAIDAEDAKSYVIDTKKNCEQFQLIGEGTEDCSVFSKTVEGRSQV